MTISGAAALASVTPNVTEIAVLDPQLRLTWHDRLPPLPHLYLTCYLKLLRYFAGYLPAHKYDITDKHAGTVILVKAGCDPPPTPSHPTSMLMPLYIIVFSHLFWPVLHPVLLLSVAWVHVHAIVSLWSELRRSGRMRVIKDKLHEPWVLIWKYCIMALQRNSPLILLLLLLVKMGKIIILQAVWNRRASLLFLPLSYPQSFIFTPSNCLFLFLCLSHTLHDSDTDFCPVCKNTTY